nr:hypothetical protein [Anaerofilum sp. An201]
MADTSKEKVGFGTSMLGFNKQEVLEYIDRLSARAREAEQQHVQQTELLQSTVESLQSENSRALDELRKSVMALRDERQRAQKAQEQMQALQAQVEEERKASGDFKNRLFDREQEVVVLRRENTQLNQALAFKTAEMDQLRQQCDARCRQAEQELEEARAQAADILEKARAQAQELQQSTRAQLPRAAAGQEKEQPQALETMAKIEERLKEAQAQLDAAAAQLRRSAKLAAGVLGDARSDLHSLERELARSAAPRAARPSSGCALADRLLEKVNRMLEQKPASACTKG